MLLSNTSLENAKNVAENIRKYVESLIIELPSNNNLNFTISLGISNVWMNDETSIETSLKRADDALYYAKKNGKNMSYSI